MSMNESHHYIVTICVVIVIQKSKRHYHRMLLMIIGTNYSYNKTPNTKFKLTWNCICFSSVSCIPLVMITIKLISNWLSIFTIVYVQCHIKNDISSIAKTESSTGNSIQTISILFCKFIQPYLAIDSYVVYLFLLLF